MLYKERIFYIIAVIILLSLLLQSVLTLIISILCSIFTYPFYVEGSDNILQPLFLRQGIRAPLSVLLLTIVCGITVFGPIGLIIAPVMLAIAIQLIAEADLGFDRAR